METAFDLEPDEKVAVLNHDETFVYLVQLDRREQSMKELQSRFLSDSVNGWLGGGMMNAVRRQQSQQQLYADLTEKIGLNLEGLIKMAADNDQ